MDMDEIQLPVFHVHPLPGDVIPPVLPTLNQQSLEATPTISISHGEGMLNIVVHPSP